MGLGIGNGIWWPYGPRTIVPGIIADLVARADYSENIRCTTATLTAIENIQYIEYPLNSCFHIDMILNSH